RESGDRRSAARPPRGARAHARPSRDRPRCVDADRAHRVRRRGDHELPTYADDAADREPARRRGPERGRRMKVVVMHSADALEDPVDPVLAQVRDALAASGHVPDSLAVADDVAPIVDSLRHAGCDLVFNLTESFGGKSALESNVAALLNLLGLRYT